MVPPELVAAARAGCSASASFLAGVEGAINGAAVQSLSDVGAILRQPGAVLTARTTKYVLQKVTAEGVPRLAALVAALPPHMVAQLAAGADADGYSAMPALAAPAAALRRLAATSATRNAGAGATTKELPRPLFVKLAPARGAKGSAFTLRTGAGLSGSAAPAGLPGAIAGGQPPPLHPAQLMRVS
jgi:hypothetical protein